MPLNVFHRFPMLSFQLLFYSGKQKEVTWSQVGTVRGLEDHRGTASDQEVSDNEGRVAWGVVVAKLEIVLMSTLARATRLFSLLSTSR